MPHVYGYRIVLALCALFYVFAGSATAQTGRIAGVVTDQNGVSLPGANVVVDSTTTGGATDLNGRYEIAGLAPGSYSIRATYLGYEDRVVPGVVVRAGEVTTLDIVLQESAVMLGETVVVGYGVQSRRNVTGAVASVSSDELEKTTTNNFAQSLQGLVPGLTVSTNTAGAEGNDLSIILRGRNSITASNRPLLIVDGIPYNGSISEINQDDIASIEVLRDVSSAAIYGSRGSNGVILITTKRGTQGETRVRYSGSVGSSDIVNMPHLMTGPEFAAFKCERLGGGDDCSSVLTPTEVANLEAGVSTDWVGLATRTGMRHDHNVSISGGAGGTTFYLGGSFLDVQGVARNDDFRRYTTRANVSQRAFGWLEIGTNNQFSVADRGGIPASFSDAFYMNPLTEAHEDGGSLRLLPWPEDTFFNNPLEGTLATDDDVSQRLFTSNFAQVSLPFIEGLSYRLNAGAELLFRQQGRYYGRNTQTGLTVLGDARLADSFDRNWTLENMLRYTREFGEHDVDLTTLYSAEQATAESNVINSQGFPNDVLTYYQANVASLVVPSYGYTKTSLVSQMARLNYNYASRYLVTLTVRRDGYSGFGANNKYATFPSVALGWNVDQEPFYPQNRVVDRLKLRFAYGQNGNQAISPYRTLAALREQSYVDGETTLPGYLPSSLGNPNLRWETTTSLNLGLDFSLLSGRVQGTFDTYFNDTEDLLLNRAISPIHGITSITENIGQTSNKGVELQLSSINFERGGFSWQTDFNVSTNRNRITALYGNGQDTDLLNEWFVGHPVLVNYGYRFDGIFQEDDDIAGSAQPDAEPGDVRVLDLNGDGEITPDDRTFIGSREPDFIAGLSNTFSYKNLSLTVNLNTVQGVQRSNSLLSTNLVFSDVRRNIPLYTYWTPENPIDTYPANRDGANPYSVAFYEDASFVRLRDVSLSYTIPTRLAQILGVRGLEFQVSGHNLLTWSDWSGLDPEINSQRAIPLERTYTVGLNLSL